ncbi:MULTISPECIES: alpha/beta hydrolase-fold protein [Mumia]|uniref:alpha/beta hydrolase-fold protein n=1 Tax=Mumia TaxID=1546255 RepID=UPI00141E266D|nr:alpha/beta hydrolase-fold protein [Mumia sp. ZJ1417]QMW66742.1 hypothetical protein H4N58_01885 [Mumia sp. ZJ1417]
MSTSSFWRNGLRAAAAILGASALTVVVAGHAATPADRGGHDRRLGTSPVLKHTGKAPTGYSVTFRYYAPTASRVQIKGEWSFVRPSALPQVASTPDHTVESQGILPLDWRPGDAPMPYPNSTDPNFPVNDMAKERNGVWTFTTPLPSGVFTYAFFVDCPTDNGAGCTPVSDPSNAPWNEKNDTVTGSAVPNSQVYVPSDSRFGTVDYSWQAPAKKQGKLRIATYSSPGHVTPVDENRLVVYTPPSYDPRRSEPYPTLYLNHGGGENEMGWSTQGDVKNIMDNLIATGEVVPMVVVMPNANGYPASTDNAAFRSDLIDRIIPWVEDRYHVSTTAADRAFSGLSAGGRITNHLMLNDTEQFGYYGMMSAGLAPGQTLSDEQVTALKKVSVFIGAGWQDVIFAKGFNNFHTGPAMEVSTFVDAGVPVTPDFVHGGHNWNVWRLLLKDFVTRVAFLPQPFASWEG